MTVSIEKPLSRRFIYNAGKTEHPFSSRALAAKESIERKVRDGIYSFAEAPCFCGWRDADSIATVDSYGLWHPMALCHRCGLLRANPRMTRESYIGFYADEYRALYGDYDIELDALYQIRLTQSEALQKYIRQQISDRFGTVLDVGCHMGAMLVPFYKEGSQAYGVDFNEEFLRLGREKTGISGLLRGDVGAFQALGKRADLILCSHVVEHLLDLEGELKRLRDALNPGGYIYVEVPGTIWWTKNICGGDLLGLFQNAHTWQFDVPLLTYVMECCGFELVHTTERIRSLFRPSDRFRDKNDVPPGRYQAVRDYLRSTESWFLPKWYAKKAVKRLLGR